MELSSDVKRGAWVIFLIVVALAVMMLFVTVGLKPILDFSNTETVSLPILTIVGVMILLFCLAVVSVAFAALNLSDKTQALALPEGSVRAVIALCLLVLFAIVSIFLFSSLSDPVRPVSPVSGPITTITGLTKEALDLNTNNKDLICVVVKAYKEREEKEMLYSAECRQKVDDDAKARQRAKEDFAKQLLILIGTLVTAVSSFYFGTRAVATQAETRPSATLASVDKPKVPAGSGTTDIMISGNNLDLIREVKLVSGSEELIGTDVTSNAQTVKLKVSFEKANPDSLWDVVATDANQRVIKLQGAVKVTTDVPQATTTSKLDPPQGAKANWPGQFKIEGQNLDKATTVNLKQGPTTVAAEIKSQTSGELVFAVDQGKVTAGKWDVEIVDNKGTALATSLVLEVTS